MKSKIGLPSTWAKSGCPKSPRWNMEMLLAFQRDSFWAKLLSKQSLSWIWMWNENASRESSTKSPTRRLKVESREDNILLYLITDQLKEEVEIIQKLFPQKLAVLCCLKTSGYGDVDRRRVNQSNFEVRLWLLVATNKLNMRVSFLEVWMDQALSTQADLCCMWELNLWLFNPIWRQTCAALSWTDWKWKCREIPSLFEAHSRLQKEDGKRAESCTRERSLSYGHFLQLTNTGTVGQ